MRRAAAALALFLFPAAGLAASPAELSIVDGDVSYLGASAGSWVKAAPAQALSVHDSIKTGAASRAVLFLPGGSQVLLHSNTLVRLERKGSRSAALSVGPGEIEAWQHKGWFKSLDLRTPVSVATLRRGAALRIFVDESGASAWDVFEGKVKVRRPDVWIKLSADRHVGLDRLGSPSPMEYVIGTVRPSLEPKRL